MKLSDIIEILPEANLFCFCLIALMVGVFIAKPPKKTSGDKNNIQDNAELGIEPGTPYSTKHREEHSGKYEAETTKREGVAFTASFWLIFVGVLISALNIIFFIITKHSEFSEFEIFSGHFVNGILELFFKFILLFIFMLILLSIKIKKKAALQFELPILMALATLGAMFVISSGSFFTFYLGVEILSISSYIIITSVLGNFNKLISTDLALNDDASKIDAGLARLSLSSEAGLKYFVLGSLASGLILFGISLMYGFSGSSYFSDMGEFLLTDFYIGANTGSIGNTGNIIAGSTGGIGGVSGIGNADGTRSMGGMANIGFLTGVIIFLCGFFFKLSAVPFHMWLPDVYEGSSKLAINFIGSISKVAVVGFLLRFMLFDAGAMLGSALSQIFILVALASVAVGAFMGIRQKNIKKLFAYSSISHMGFLLLAFAGMDGANMKEAINAITIYVFIYATLVVGGFACLMVTDALKVNKEIVKVKDFAGLGKINPTYAFCFSIILFSLAGIPPMAGFFIKFFVLQIAVEAGLIIPCLLAVIFSVVSAFYYLNIIKIMWFEEQATELKKEHQEAIKHPNIYAKILIGSVVILNLFFIIFANKILATIDNMAIMQIG